MDRCHYIYDRATGERILIPGCMGVAVHYNDEKPLVWCTCASNKVSQEQRIDKLEKEIKELKKQFNHLKSLLENYE